jgi:hypothetical protein
VTGRKAGAGDERVRVRVRVLSITGDGPAFVALHARAVARSFGSSSV